MAGTLIIDTLRSGTTSPPVIENSSGVDFYLARAWVNFNGTGTVAIRASGNVSSITDNGVGDYTVNFTNAMPDLNYFAGVSAGDEPGGRMSFWEHQAAGPIIARTASTFQVRTGVSSRPGFYNEVLYDVLSINIAIFR